MERNGIRHIGWEGRRKEITCTKKRYFRKKIEGAVMHIHEIRQSIRKNEWEKFHAKRKYIFIRRQEGVSVCRTEVRHVRLRRKKKEMKICFYKGWREGEMLW
jgi:hypothetical protein